MSIFMFCVYGFFCTVFCIVLDHLYFNIKNQRQLLVIHTHFQGSIGWETVTKVIIFPVLNCIFPVPGISSLKKKKGWWQVELCECLVALLIAWINKKHQHILSVFVVCVHISTHYCAHVHSTQSRYAAYIFILMGFTVVLSLEKRTYPKNSCIVILNKCTL